VGPLRKGACVYHRVEVLASTVEPSLLGWLL
jgi:hypothetical protein